MKQIVVISGGSDGLGKAIAQQLQKKYEVIILSPTSSKLSSVAKEIGVDFEKCDVSNYKDCSDAINNIVKRYKSIDVLINNAGLWIQDELDDNDPEYIKKVVKVNGLGPVYLSKVTIPVMKKQKSGTIVNINSQGGFYAKGERSVYSLTKWGLTGFSKSLQLELAKYSIRVTDVHPGKMKTRMFEKMGIEKDMSDGLDPKNVAQIIEAILRLPAEVVVPELGIKYITN